VGWGGVGSVMFASLGCKARVGVYSLLSYVGLQLLSVLFRWLMLKSFGYGFCGLDKKEKKNKTVLGCVCVWVGDSCPESQLSGD